MGLCDCYCLDGLWPKARLINDDIIRGFCPKRCVDDWAWDSLFRDFYKVTFKNCGCKPKPLQANETWQEKKLGCKFGWPRNNGRIAEMSRCTGCNDITLKQILLDRKECSAQNTDWYSEPIIPYCKYPPDSPCKEYDEDQWSRLGEKSIGDEYWNTAEWMKGLNDLYHSVVNPPEESDDESFELLVTEDGQVVKRRRSRRRRRSIRKRKHHSKSKPKPEPLPRYTVSKVYGYPSRKVSVEGRVSRVSIAVLKKDQNRYSAPLHIAFSGEINPVVERENKPRMSYVGSNVFYGRAMKQNRALISQKNLTRMSTMHHIEIVDPQDTTVHTPRTPRIAFRSQIDARLERENKPRMSYVGSNVFYGREMKRNSEVNSKDLAQYQNLMLPHNSSIAESAVVSGVSVAKSDDPESLLSYSTLPSKHSSDKSSRGLQMAKSHHSTAAMPQISSYGTSEASWGNHNDNLDASEDYFETPIQVKRLSMVAPPPAFVPITSSIRRMLETKPGKSALRKNEDTETSPQRLTFRDPSQQSHNQDRRRPSAGARRKSSSKQRRKSK